MIATLRPRRIAAVGIGRCSKVDPPDLAEEKKTDAIVKRRIHVGHTRNEKNRQTYLPKGSRRAGPPKSHFSLYNRASEFFFACI
jgi:hypothetical protein